MAMDEHQLASHATVFSTQSAATTALATPAGSMAFLSPMNINVANWMCFLQSSRHPRSTLLDSPPHLQPLL